MCARRTLGFAWSGQWSCVSAYHQHLIVYNIEWWVCDVGETLVWCWGGLCSPLCHILSRLVIFAATPAQSYLDQVLSAFPLGIVEGWMPLKVG